MKNVQLKSLALATLVLSAGPIMAEEVRGIREITTVEEAKKAMANLAEQKKALWLLNEKATGKLGVAVVLGATCFALDGKARLCLIPLVPTALGFGYFGLKDDKAWSEANADYEADLESVCAGLNNAGAEIKAFLEGQADDYLLHRCKQLKN